MPSLLIASHRQRPSLDHPTQLPSTLNEACAMNRPMIAVPWRQQLRRSTITSVQTLGCHGCDNDHAQAPTSPAQVRCCAIQSLAMAAASPRSHTTMRSPARGNQALLANHAFTAEAFVAASEYSSPHFDSRCSATSGQGAIPDDPASATRWSPSCRGASPDDRSLRTTPDNVPWQTAAP